MQVNDNCFMRSFDFKHGEIITIGLKKSINSKLKYSQSITCFGLKS